MSRLKRYKALSLDTCMQAAQRDFGADAVIHAVRSRREGPFFRRRLVHELLAGPASDLQSMAAAGSAHRPSPSDRIAPCMSESSEGRGDAASPDADLRSAVAKRAYGAATSGVVSDLDRKRTRLLAQAMAIRLERDEAARRLAEANEVETRRRMAPDIEAGVDISHPLPADDLAEGESASALNAPSARRFLLVPAAGVRHATAPGDLLAAEVADPARAVSILASDLRALRALVERVVQARETGDDRELAEAYLASPAPWTDSVDASLVGEPLAGFYATLIGHAMAADLARRLIEETHSQLSAAERLDPVTVRMALRDRVMALLPTTAPSEPVRRRGVEGRMGRPHVISLVGPTGTGKTTTIAKLAAGFALSEGRKVGLVTTDTFRIAAVEQLRTYADIVGLPLHVAKGEEGVRAACETLADRDIVLIDTAGRGHTDRERLAELARLVRAAEPDETHLVLSATGRDETLVAQAHAFAGVGVDRVVVSKLDEAVGFGVLLGALSRIGQPVSWLTTGQHVPDDIEPARADRLAELVLGGVAA